MSEAVKAEPGEGLRESLRQTYWAVVGRAYWRGIQTKAATAWVGVLLVLTVMVPFIANKAPYTAVINGERDYPLFRNLTRVDLTWLVAAAAVAAYGAGHWWIERKVAEVEQLRARRMKWLGWVLGATALLVGAVMLRSDYLDVRNYGQLEQGGQMQGAVFAPLRWGYAEQEPLELDVVNKAPSWWYAAGTADGILMRKHWHWLGTDNVGRDVLARLLWGARIVLEIGFVSEIISVVIGMIFGAVMGYFVGRVDMLGMRLLEVVESIPLLILLITFVAVFGRQLFMIMVIIGLTGWTGIARFVRAEFLRMRGMDYVSAAKAMGLPLRNILFRHMLPNGLTPVIVTFTFGVAGNIVSESILSFLGVGVEPPTASWGAMLEQAGNPGVVLRWWLLIAPGVMIFLTVFSYNIIGEGLRDAIDPRTNKVE